jgi:carboxyl-terminal processing protease
VGPYRRSRRPLVPILAVLLPVLLVFGIWLGGHPSHLPGPVRDALVGDDDARLLDEAIDVIERDYYRPVSRSQLANRGVQGAVAGLGDRFSHYFDPTEYRLFARQTEGTFSGVGITVGPDRRGLRVASVIPSSPAARAGIRRGALIVAVDGRSIAGKDLEVSTALIRGRPGTPVRLTVVSAERRRVVTLRRRQIRAPIVRSRLIRFRGRTVGYVELSSFVSGAHAQVGTAVRGLLQRGAGGIVLDLRDNGGGLLDEAVLVASVFIPAGPIVSTDGRHRPRQVYRAEGGAIPRRVPLAVLVNHGTASASEIVAGAIQDRHRGELVGAHTFGKGVFQEVKPLSNGGALDITVGEYFLPSGRNLGGGGVREGSGLRPNVRAADNPRTRRDEALAAALRALAPKLR